ncbi:MAG: PaaI family thioesterase [Proteobacteria bacterium]|nr:PaaI family thioesterase [Pseudomonadota bacterium]
MNDHPAPAAPRQRLVTWDDPGGGAHARRTVSGLDLLRGIVAGSVPPPPVARLIGMDFAAVEHGSVTLRLAPGEHLYNPMGVVHGGMIATLLDSAMGCAVHSTLPAGRGYTTLEIKVNYLRAVTEASGELVAIGRTVHAGRRTGVAEAVLKDARGRTCATASTTCLIFDLDGPETSA